MDERLMTLVINDASTPVYARNQETGFWEPIMILPPNIYVFYGTKEYLDVAPRVIQEMYKLRMTGVIYEFTQDTELCVPTLWPSIKNAIGLRDKYLRRVDGNGL
ncbi:hypothetical protein KC845_03610 [Candidatus Kaiserbacteria bacterium]|nr:hypothetical protein [Candidatus Kaiserbacteria bacterium]